MLSRLMRRQLEFFNDETEVISSIYLDFGYLIILLCGLFCFLILQFVHTLVKSTPSIVSSSKQPTILVLTPVQTTQDVSSALQTSLPATLLPTTQVVHTFAPNACTTRTSHQQASMADVTSTKSILETIQPSSQRLLTSCDMPTQLLLSNPD